MHVVSHLFILIVLGNISAKSHTLTFFVSFHAKNIRMGYFLWEKIEEKLGNLSILCMKTVQMQIEPYSIQNLPQQSANAEAFAEAYLHFLISGFAIKILRQLDAWES